MLMSSGLACTSASFYMGVLLCRGGGRTTRARWEGVTLCLRLSHRFMLVKKGLLVIVFSRGGCMLLTYFDVLPCGKPPWNLKVYTHIGPKTGRTGGRPFSVLRHDQPRTYRQPPLTLNYKERHAHHGVGRLPPVKGYGIAA